MGHLKFPLRELWDHQEPSLGVPRNSSPGPGGIITEYFLFLISAFAMLDFPPTKQLFWGLLGLQVKSVASGEGWCYCLC